MDRRRLINTIDVHYNEDERIRSASYHGKCDLVKILLNSGADLHARNDEALRLASRNGHLDVVRLLIDHGANIHANDDEALRAAEQNEHTTVVEILRQYMNYKYIPSHIETLNKECEKFTKNSREENREENNKNLYIEELSEKFTIFTKFDDKLVKQIFDENSIKDSKLGFMLTTNNMHDIFTGYEYEYLCTYEYHGDLSCLRTGFTIFTKLDDIKTVRCIKIPYNCKIFIVEYRTENCLKASSITTDKIKILYEITSSFIEKIKSNEICIPDYENILKIINDNYTILHAKFFPIYWI